MTVQDGGRPRGRRVSERCHSGGVTRPRPQARNPARRSLWIGGDSEGTTKPAPTGPDAPSSTIHSPYYYPYKEISLEEKKQGKVPQ